MDQHFPLIKYPEMGDPSSWGEMHGESFRQGIKELFEIRLELMMEYRPSLKTYWEEFALGQMEATASYSPPLAQELLGIARGADLKASELIVLNNYTDFRDLCLPDEGCSTVQVYAHDKNLQMKKSFAGQTWDMHRSAKDYCAVLHVPQGTDGHSQLLFTMVGCLGMMGIHSAGRLIGINNLTTKNACPAVIWPAIVRKALQAQSFDEMRHLLLTAPVTSGHNYMLSGPSRGENWEIMPERSQLVSSLMSSSIPPGGKEGIFHTNHCLGDEIKPWEEQEEKAKSSTSQNRYGILAQRVPGLQSFEDLKSLLTDHQGYPKSICGHFESGKRDPSFTCGGGMVDFQEDRIHFWRGCPQYDKNYRSYDFKLKYTLERPSSFVQVTATP